MKFRPKVKENTEGLCYSCLATSYVDIVFTKYGAKITLCYGCIEKIVNKLVNRWGDVI